MYTVIVDTFFFGLAVSAGITSGWWIKRAFSDRREKDAVDQERAHTKEIMQQMQSLATTVAAQVGQHSSRVQEINDELVSGDVQGTEVVVTAVSQLVEANARMQEQLYTAERRLEEQRREIESKTNEARTDALTKINNRRAFDEEMRRCLESFRHFGRPSCIMMLDVDCFKQFNDAHGHKAGDEVLRYVAKTLRQTVAATEIVYRYGGEEFAVIFPGSSIRAAKEGAERARAAIGASLIPCEGQALGVTASAGLAELVAGEDVESVLKRADDALYLSKKDGRNCGHLHDGRSFERFVPKPIPTTPAPVAKEKPAPEVAEPKGTARAPDEDDSRKDPSTGLSNRTAFYDDVNRRVAEWKRGGSALSVMLMQIDQFRETTGPQADKARQLMLRAATQFLTTTMRDMDHIARYDDDIFAVLLPSANLVSAAGIAERLRRAVARCKLPFQKGQLSFTVTFGIAEAIQGDSTSRLLQRSKIALDAGIAADGDCNYLHNGDQCMSAEQFAASIAATTNSDVEATATA